MKGEIPYLVYGWGTSGKAAGALLESRGLDFEILDDSRPLPPIGSLAPVVIVSPGVAPNNPHLQRLMARGSRVMTELDLAYHLLPSNLESQWRAVGITGTNGKSSVCSLITHLWSNQCGPALSVGNIGQALCDLLAATSVEPGSLMSTELSSYQLEYLNKYPLQAAVITGLTPDHLERHGSMEEYLRCKWRICSQLEPGAPLITTQHVIDLATKQGLHHPNILVVEPDNNQLALAAVSALSNKKQNFTQHLKSYLPLPYRQQSLGWCAECEIINDSKATNIEATVYALESVTEPAVLVLGGSPKTYDYHLLLPHLDKISLVVIFGPYREQINAALPAGLTVHCYPELEQAVSPLQDLARQHKGKLLFSPSGSSVEFKNFELRGAYFFHEDAAHDDPPLEKCDCASSPFKLRNTDYY